MRFKSTYLILFFSFACILSCKKKIESPCNLNIEFDGVSCTASDTTESVNGFIQIRFSGTDQVKCEGEYMNGAKNGLWRTYYPNGNLMYEGVYRMGKMDGFWKFYYENGNIHSQGQFEECTRFSLWQYFYKEENHALKYEGGYVNGNKTGTWKSYEIEGKLFATYNCD